MSFASPMQKVQDWLTQQWVIFFGKKINPQEHPWLIGPFGNPGVSMQDYINHLAEKENLTIDLEAKTKGLIPAMSDLSLSEADYSRLSRKVIDFYENTGNYNFQLSVKWIPFFRVFGILLRKLFSNRLGQLHIPVSNSKESHDLNSELITLKEAGNDQPKYTFWLRSIKSSRESIYSGAYGTCVLPSGKTCIKAIFPLPNGNATVLIALRVGTNGELILDASGEKFGDAGFYFLLKNSKGEYWSKYIKSFRDQLIVSSTDEGLFAEQVLTLWQKEVLRFNYKISKK